MSNNGKCKILITGGAGFIASSLADALVKNPENQIVIVDNLLTGNYDKLPSERHKNWHFIRADINRYDDISSIMVSYQFNYVFHYAAVVGVNRTLQHPVQVLNDITGIRNILDLSKNTGVQCVYYASSSEVYGEPVEFPQNEETTPLNSRLPYAVVKNVGEAFLKSYHKEFDLNYCIFRFFNTYGPKQSTDFVVSKFLKAALHNRDIVLFGDGSQTRTFCYIEDNVEATVRIFEKKLYLNDVVNVGSDLEIPIRELAELIVRITGSKSRLLNHPPLKEGDMTRRKPDISKMRKVLNRELLPLEEGLKKLIDSGNF